ncbi:MAG TPA: hypothetical protein VG097_12010 [Gemmata sp.]|jgi:hypothetical protein|nr:hypothetical protein [Gemmata sp.]
MSRSPIAKQDTGIKVPKKASLPTTSVWQLQSVRLIAFPTTPPALLDQNWWEMLVGTRPKDFVSTRKLELRDDRGTIQERELLSLNVDLSRIVWEARPHLVVDKSGNYPAFDGSFREKITWFVKLLNPWLKTSCPPLLRLAFSAKLLHLANNVKEAYRVLADHLPAINLDSNPNDFQLQINRRKDSSDVVAGLGINRVSTWSKLNIEIIIEQGKPFRWPDRCYSSLELDINTAPESSEVLPRNSLPQLFLELASLGLEIAEKGDIP